MLGPVRAVALLTVFMLVQLALADCRLSATKVLLVGVVNLHVAVLSVREASSVIVCVLVNSAEQLHKAKYQ